MPHLTTETPADVASRLRNDDIRDMIALLGNLAGDKIAPDAAREQAILLCAKVGVLLPDEPEAE